MLGHMGLQLIVQLPKSVQTFPAKESDLQCHDTENPTVMTLNFLQNICIYMENVWKFELWQVAPWRLNRSLATSNLAHSSLQSLQ